MKCKAERVTLIGMTTVSESGTLGTQWSTHAVKDLEVDPERMIATCMIKGKAYTAAVSCVTWPDEETARRAGQLSKLRCDVCGDEFANKAGLEGHRSSKHPQKGKVSA
jgi:hypothetical protein